MHEALIFVKKFVCDPGASEFSGFRKEEESHEYAACTFTLNQISVKFRVAKVTPKKTGQFVALWKRNEAGFIQPHDLSDKTDLYVISVKKDNLFGQFIFPKSALLKQGILSTSEKEGKRGFRVYPSWDITSNKQAQKTQLWQSEYFLEINDDNAEQIKLLYSK